MKITVSSSDVLMGRGRHGHSGNLELQIAVKEASCLYETLCTSQKTVMSAALVDFVREQQGGRFLTTEAGANGDIWVEATHRAACRKVAHMFRDAKRLEYSGKRESGRSRRLQKPLHPTVDTLSRNGSSSSSPGKRTIALEEHDPDMMGLDFDALVSCKAPEMEIDERALCEELSHESATLFYL